MVVARYSHGQLVIIDRLREMVRLGAGGVFEGMTRVTRQIQMAGDGKSFTSVVSTQFFDITDTLIAEGCGKESATRVF